MTRAATTDSAFSGPLVSIHDVMPGTLAAAESIAGQVSAAGMGEASLLVVPGRGWDATGIARLGSLAAAGHALVGHGWSHRAERIRGLRHRLHSLLMSRNVAEHMALDADGIAGLIRRCRDWFDAHGLPPPELYVPPAWALGRIPRARLAGLGFRYYETLTGILDSETGQFRQLPLMGYEADSRLRAVALRAANRINAVRARRLGAVRIAIHPADFRLRLAADLRRALAGPPTAGCAA